MSATYTTLTRSGLAAATAFATWAFATRAPAQEPATDDQLASAAKSVDTATTAVRAARDRLVGDLDARAATDDKAGAACDLLLRLPEGADYEDAEVVLRRRGGQWVTAYGVVPAWREEGFYEKFNYVHRGASRAVARDTLRHAADASALVFDGVRLTGELGVGWRINELRDERFPPGTPVRWKSTGEKFTQMELLSELVHQTPRHQRYALNAAVVPGVQEFTLEFERSAVAPPLVATVQVPAQPWLRGMAKAPNWNGGYHIPDASGLSFKDGKLTGTLKALFTPDAWFPKTPQVAIYELNGEAKHGIVSGTFKASGTFGEFEGPFTGRCGAFVRGTYRAEGEMGAYETDVYGRVREPTPRVATLLPPEPPAPAAGAAPADALRANVARLAAAYHQFRAVSLAARQYPLPLESAIAQTAVPAPDWAPPAPLTADHAADIAAWAGGTAALAAQAAAEPAAVVGVPTPPAPDFGPYFEPVVLPTDAAGACVLPPPAAGPQQWACLPRWRWLGPMRIVDDLENDFTELPDLTPAWTAIYPIYGDRLPRAKDKKPETTAGWVLVSNATGRISVPWSSEPGRSRSPGSVWYAAGEIASDADREVWVGIAAADHGKLWVNGRLVWTAEETMWRAYDKREAVLKIPLKKGVNRLLIRVREDRAWTWARFQVCVRGAPASAGAAAPAATAAAPAAPAAKMLDDRGDGYGRFPDAAPPLAWDLEKGINVAWKRVLDVKTSSGAVAVGERLFLRADPHTLLCLDARDGKTLWRQDACILELTDPAAFAKYQACATDAERAALLTTLRAPSSSAVCSPVTDGQTVWTCYSSGVVAAYDMDGKRRWLVRVNAAPGAMRVTDGLVLVEGGGPTATAHRLVALDAATGAEKWGRDLPGAYNRGSLNLLHVEGHGRARAMALTSDLAVVDPLTGQTLLSRADADSSEGSALYVADSDVFFGKLSKATGMRYFLDADGQVGCRFLFRSHYGIKYDRSTPCFALGPWFMVVCTVQEDCKGHSNAARRELYAYDRVTGMPIKRIKPVLDQAQVEFRPTSAGPYVFVQDSGGGSSGGRDDAGQFAVVRMDGSSRLLSWNLVPMGDADTPSFAGKRMFVRIRDTLYCFATLTEDGRRYERETAAKMLLADLRAAPADEAYPAPKPLAAAPDPAVVPAARFVKDIGLLEWITAGPFPFKPLAQEPGLEAKLAALSPALGASLEIGGRSAAFAAVALRQTSAIYTYGHSYYLCGIGGTTANLSATVDLTALTGGEPDSCVVLHTVVRNARDQIVTLMAPPTGVDLWFAGRKARAFDAYRLAPGYYPLLVRADPAVAGAKLSISFRPQDDPLAARQAWLLGLNAAEDDIRAIVRGLPNSPELAQAVGLLAELDGFKAELDLRRVARMAGNDGTGEFPLARPPVPWERGANLRWTATLPGAAGPGAVASGDRAFVAVAPATLACLSVAKGETLWTKPVGKSDAKNAVCAPAADAGRVFAVTALGEAVCLRAGDGSSVWSRELPEAAPPAFAALAGKVLVTQAGAVHGLDAATGRPLWTKKLPANAAGFAPVPLKIGAVPGILIGTGECLDAGDGRPLGSLPRPLSGSRPCRVGALLGLATADGKLVARPLPGGAAGGWEVAAGGRVTAGPVGAEGMVYAVIADAELLALRSVDGAMAWRQKLPAGGRDVRLALGGQRVFVCNLGADSRTVVLEPGDAYGTQWEYAVPGGVSEPFFLGRDAFVRAGDTLFCVGGAPPRDPGAFAEPATAAADAAFQPADGVPVVPFESNLMPAKWLVAAPFKPRTLETDLLVALGGRAKARPAPGTKVSAEGKEVEFRALAPTAVWRDPKFTGGLDAVDLVEPIGKDWNSTALLYTVLDNDAERIVEARVLTPGGIQWNAKDRLEAAIWVGGVRVVEGDLVRLPAGKVPVLIQAGVGELKTSGKIWMAPRFVDRTGDVAGQLEKLKARKAVWDAFRKSSSELAVLKK